MINFEGAENMTETSKTKRRQPARKELGEVDRTSDPRSDVRGGFLNVGWDGSSDRPNRDI